MKLGVSTACLYPNLTENALEYLGKNDVKTVEVFLNSFGETSLDFAKKLNGIKENYGMEIVSVHPFSSFAETYMLFGDYERRFNDALDFYKRCFEVTASLGADISVIHGSKNWGKLNCEQYSERFQRLISAGKEFGVRVAQENVFDYFSEKPDFLHDMKTYLGEDFKLVFDVKQTVKAGYDTFEFAKKFAKDIIHVHLSDNNEKSACIAPGKGNFDFSSFFRLLENNGYNGSCVIELYRSSYETESDIIDSFCYIKNSAKNA